MLALFYALCSVAPSASFAFGDGTLAAHCLTGDDDHALHAAEPHHHPATTVHTHADGTSHVHVTKADATKPDNNGKTTDGKASGGKTSDGKTSDGKTSDGKCCGLFCVPAMSASLAIAILPDLPRVTAIAAVQRNATGQPPVRLDRPPNSPLSL